MLRHVVTSNTHVLVTQVSANRRQVLSAFRKKLMQEQPLNLTTDVLRTHIFSKLSRQVCTRFKLTNASKVPDCTVELVRGWFNRAKDAQQAAAAAAANAVGRGNVVDADEDSADDDADGDVDDDGDDERDDNIASDVVEARNAPRQSAPVVHVQEPQAAASASELLLPVPRSSAPASAPVLPAPCSPAPTSSAPSSLLQMPRPSAPTTTPHRDANVQTKGVTPDVLRQKRRNPPSVETSAPTATTDIDYANASTFDIDVKVETAPPTECTHKKKSSDRKSARIRSKRCAPSRRPSSNACTNPSPRHTALAAPSRATLQIAVNSP